MSDLNEKDLPLAGVKVLEFCTVAAGPFCGMLLADMGADVVKIEPPDGDTLRQWPPISAGFSENFASLNRNKRSVVLNLKQPEDVALARQLMLEADVVVENNRPGVMDRLGLGYASLREDHPGLVYCSVSAYGQSGPRATEGGFDLTIQAAAGVMSVTGEPDGAPVKCGVPLADFASGLYGAFAIASALARVRAGGAGMHIDVPMYGCTLGIAALQTSEYFGTGRSPAKLGSAHPRNAPYQAFQAADGYFAIAAGNQKLWLEVVRVVEMPELAEDPRFATTRDRAANQVALKDLLEQRFARAGVDHWIAAFQAAGVPHARINDYAAALQDPQVEHMEWVRPLTLPSGVATRTFVSPLRLDGMGLPVRRPPPALGEHTEAVRAAHAGGAAEQQQGQTQERTQEQSQERTQKQTQEKTP
ncbi:CoA transferase [Cupriavidus sp. DB3]|uniref:CaiB/BaiF CoA transferase family protein n=1 Tax=Cupriavidus sp. DB3 TaxID=2873259 RepID=UPI001CF0FE23|nr:CoA transferase [Cupriavidus sp. DB3]MCA7083643.1 CoA transferase [Cupriavidus sp. DB3]